MYCGRRQLHTKAESSLLYPVQVQEQPWYSPSDDEFTSLVC